MSSADAVLQSHHSRPGAGPWLLPESRIGACLLDSFDRCQAGRKHAVLCLHQYGTHTCWNCNNLTAVCSIFGEQVKQSQEHLLERLYAYVTGLKPQELDMLLDEDSELTQKRAAAQMTIKVGLVQPGIAASGFATGFCWPCCCSCSCGMWFWLPVQAAKFGQNEIGLACTEGDLQRGCAARSPQSRPV